MRGSAYAMRQPLVAGTRGLVGAATAAVGIVSGVGMAVSPFLTTGIATGTALLVFALMQPLVLVGVMLVLGPIDLSFVTGGFKTMFEQLGGLDMNGIRLVGMTGALSFVVLVDRRVGRQVFRPASMFYALLIVYAAFTLTFSPAPIDGARLLFKLAWPLLLFLVVAGLATTREQLDRLLDAVLIGAAVIGLVLNPFYVAFGDFEREVGGWMRLQGVGTHQNPFAFYLLAVLLMSFVRFTTRRQWRYLVLCAVCSTWMVLTVTRIAFLAAVVALMAVGAASAIAMRNYRVLFGAAAVMLLLAIPFAPPVLERTFGHVPGALELVRLFADPKALYLAINWEGRQVYWPVVAAAFMSAPVTGLGLGSSAHVLRVYFPSYWSDVVHNDYLRLLSDTGLIGAVLFTSALVAWVTVAMRGLRTGDRTVREYALPAIGCIAGLAIIGITDNAFDYYGAYTQYAGFLCGGTAAAMAIVQRERLSEQSA